MVINTEWGNLQMDNYRNAFDVIIDKATGNPGLQTFEKMISGLYLGEICRTTILHPSVARALKPQTLAHPNPDPNPDPNPNPNPNPI